MLVGVVIMIINRTVKSVYMMHSWSRLFTVSHIEVNRFDPRTAIFRRQSLFGESHRGYIEHRKKHDALRATTNVWTFMKLPLVIASYLRGL